MKKRLYEAIIVIVLFVGILLYANHVNKAEEKILDIKSRINTESFKISMSECAISTLCIGTEMDDSLDKISNETGLDAIVAGDFSFLQDSGKEEIETVCHIMREQNRDKWIYHDLNGDGIEELILQEQRGNRDIIVGIFCYEDNGVKCVFWDVNDCGEYCFYGQTGELMYYYRWNTGVYTMESYKHFNYDIQWNKMTDYTLYIYKVVGSEKEGHTKQWKEQHPDMLNDGLYYRKYVEDTQREEAITEDELNQIFYDEMGFAMD